MRLARRVARTWLSTLLLWAAACEQASAPDAAAYSGRLLSWQRQRAPLETNGSTAALEFGLARAGASASASASAARVFGLRAYPAAPSAALQCFALRDVIVNGTDTWVAADTAADSGDYCSACAQRVSVGSDYAFAVLPSAGDAALQISAVSARIALYDCLTLTAQPLSAGASLDLWVELASWSPPEPSAALALPLSVVVATDYGLPDAALLPAALASLRSIWATADIRLLIEPPLTIAAPQAPVLYSAVDRQALDELARAAGELLPVRAASYPVLILVPCLLRTDMLSGGRSEPWALTTHLPGGAAVGGAPDAIFIAAERCEGLSPMPRFSDAALLGAVMAHELGHYLGLYHVNEQDGRQDQLSDTDVSEPNLMQATPAAAATALSASQVAIARRHSAFATSP